MAEQTEAGGEAAIAEEPGKVWRPSGSPVHRGDPSSAAAAGRIIQQEPVVGVLGTIGNFLRRRFVRLVIGLGIFILAAIVYDETINFGDWTERKERPRATKHPGLAPIEQTPDG